MSSSPRQAPLPPPANSRSAAFHPPEVLPFCYGEAAARPRQSDLPLADRQLPATAAQGDAPRVAPDIERESQLRELGRQQGIQEARARFEEQLAAVRAAVARALAEFSRERAEYYRKLEEEAVQLTLAIARKVIHRETQVDPLVLMGIVRAALDRIEGATGVTLLVHPQQAAEWRSYLSSSLAPGDMPEIAEDPAIAPQQCMLRTSMGTAKLGFEVQLKEIEKGLMDLLAARPGEKS